MRILAAFKWAIAFLLLVVVCLFDPSALIMLSRQIGEAGVLVAAFLLMVLFGALFLRDYRKWRGWNK